MTPNSSADPLPVYQIPLPTTPTDEHHTFDISEFLSAERTILDVKLNFSLLSGKAAFAGTGSRDRLALGERPSPRTKLQT